jgi:hypothetical protein
MGYGTSFIDAYHQAGVYTGRKLKGDKPGDLPVLCRRGFAINLKRLRCSALRSPLVSTGQVVPRSYLHRTGQLAAFLHGRRPALVDIGG